MTNRWKLWLGASALAITSGALPVGQIAAPITTALFGVDLTSQANAQESTDESGEDAGTPTECTTETGEGDESGSTTECPQPQPSSEDGEGEG